MEVTAAVAAMSSLKWMRARIPLEITDTRENIRHRTVRRAAKDAVMALMAMILC